MKVTYYVEDGYISGSRPQHVTIDDADLEEFETDAQKIEYIEECIENHFKENISWSWNRNLKP